MNDFSDSGTEYAHTVYASFSRRLLAFLLDSLMYLPFFIGLYLALQGSIDYGWLDPAADWHLLVIGVIWFELLIGLPIMVTLLYWVKRRGTPGKLALNLRVVDAYTGENVKFRQALIRSAGYLLSALPLFAGFIWATGDPRKQSWHDRLARTVVVFEPQYPIYPPEAFQSQPRAAEDDEPFDELEIPDVDEERARTAVLEIARAEGAKAFEPFAEVRNP